MWNGKKVSLVMATYKEKDSIEPVLRDFIATDFADEIIVVDNNAEPGTREAVASLASPYVRVVHEPRQGYGYAFRRGYEETTGDYIVTVEPDGTYVGGLRRFLVFAEEFDVVLGSRTILKAKNKDWGYWRREINILYGFLIHFLFNTHMITDIGCTYKLMSRKAYQHLAPLWRHTTSVFATELLLSVVRENLNFTEIPVIFTERVGPSVVLDSRIKLTRLACYHIKQIVGAWWQWKFRGNIYPQP